MDRKVNLGLIQLSCAVDVQANFDKTVGFIEQAAGQGAQIICTQELFKTRYFCQTMDNENYKLAEVVKSDSPTIEKLSTLAGDLQIVLIASLFEKRAAGIYHNTAVVIDADGTFLGKYRKMHIPQDPGYTEKYYFTPGDLGYQVFRTKFADLGVLICWDQWFPEAARLTAMKGAEIIFCPTAIGFDPDHSRSDDREESHAAWQIVQQGHAAANACYLAAINRVGFEESPDESGGIQFWGGSFVANPSGQLLVKASMEDEENLLCPIDLSRIEEIRNISSYPFRDRRVDSYQELTELYSN